MNIKPVGDKFQLRIRSKLIGKDYYETFDSSDIAEATGALIEESLKRGVIPPAILNRDAAPVAASPLFSAVVLKWVRESSVSKADHNMVDLYLKEVASVRVNEITFTWVNNYVRDCKVQKNLAPSSIAKRVALWGRALAWYISSTHAGTGAPPANPFRLLERGYSTYKESDRLLVEKAGLTVKHNVERDRRLAPAEKLRLLRALDGHKDLGDGVVKFKPLKKCPYFRAMVLLILTTGIRRFEAYRSTKSNFNLETRVFNVPGSKGHYGVVKWRNVPLQKELCDLMAPLLEGDPEDLIFPFWDGTEAGRAKTKNMLDNRFAKLFEYCEIPDFTEHDLRHEATCGWMTFRTKAGAWMFSETEVLKIMGWTDPRLLKRYLSLRGEDLVRFED